MVLDKTSKHRLVGAGIMIACAAVVLPMVLDGEKPAELDIVINMPEPPELVVPVIRPVQPLPENDVSKSPDEIKLIDEKAISKANEKESGGSELITSDAVKETPKAGVTSSHTEPETSTPKKPALKPGVRWTVQIATFKNGENATRLVKKLKEAGYPAYKVTTQSLNKVFVGPEIERKQSEKSRTDIEKEFLLKGIVVKFSPN